MTNQTTTTTAFDAIACAERIHTLVCDHHDATAFGAIRTAVEKSIEAKASLERILERSRYWRPESRAIIVPASALPAAPRERGDEDKRQLYAIAQGFKFLGDNHYNAIFEALEYNRQYIMGDEDLPLYLGLGLRKPAKDMKMSRVINSILRHAKYDIEHKSIYNVVFPDLANKLNDEKIPVNIIISLNPIDYITMSDYSRNKWRTCHNYVDGEYKAGTVDLMLDNATMVLYTVENIDGDITQQKMLTRNLISYENGIILQHRIYPNKNEDQPEAAALYRKIVEEIISEGLNVPNFWSKKEIARESRLYKIAGDMHYNDYYHYDTCYTVTHKTLYTEGRKIHIGAPALCLACGEEHITEGSELICNRCKHNCVVCEACGREMDEDSEDIVYIDGEAFCRDCAEYCDHCETDHRGDSTQVCDRYGNYIYVCDDCLRRYYRYCDICETYHYCDRTSEAVDADGRHYYICNNCWDHDTHCVCERCDNSAESADTFSVITDNGDELYCYDCFRSLDDQGKIAVCKKCEKFHRVNNFYGCRDYICGKCQKIIENIEELTLAEVI